MNRNSRSEHAVADAIRRHWNVRLPTVEGLVEEFGSGSAPRPFSLVPPQNANSLPKGTNSCPNHADAAKWLRLSNGEFADSDLSVTVAMPAVRPFHREHLLLPRSWRSSGGFTLCLTYDIRGRAWNAYILQLVTAETPGCAYNQGTSLERATSWSTPLCTYSEKAST